MGPLEKIFDQVIYVQPYNWLIIHKMEKYQRLITEVSNVVQNIKYHNIARLTKHVSTLYPGYVSHPMNTT